MIEKTCKTCLDNEDGFCDRKGILVDDEDSCEKHREDWCDRLLDHFLRGHGKGRQCGVLYYWDIVFHQWTCNGGVLNSPYRSWSR